MKKDSTFSLSDAMKELAAIEAEFQKPDLDLAYSLKKHQEAKALAKTITTYLHEMETTLETIESGSL